MATAVESKESLDQIREIIVGGIQHDLERRLSRVEAHLATRMTDVQQEARRRTEVIEAHLLKETQALTSRLEGELVEIRDALRGLTRDHRETCAALEQRMAKAEEHFNHGQHELRQQVLEQTKQFLDEVQRVRAEVSETLERELSAFELAPEEEGISSEPRAADERASRQAPNPTSPD